MHKYINTYIHTCIYGPALEPPSPRGHGHGSAIVQYIWHGGYGEYGMFDMYGMFGMYGWYGMYGMFGMYGMYGRCGMYGMYGWYCTDGRGGVWYVSMLGMVCLI